MNEIDAARASVGLIVVLAALVLCWLILTPEPVGRDGTWAFEAKRVLSEENAEVYRALQAALTGMMRFPSVALDRMLYVRLEGSAKDIHERTVWRRRIAEKSVEFVVCDANAQIFAVVDLRTPEELRRASRRMQEEKE